MFEQISAFRPKAFTLHAGVLMVFLSLSVFLLSCLCVGVVVFVPAFVLFVPLCLRLFASLRVSVSSWAGGLAIHLDEQNF